MDKLTLYPVYPEEVVAAYRRVALTVTGNGRSTVADLMKRSGARGVDLRQRTARRLAHIGYTTESVLEAGVTIRLLDSANLSTGGTSHDVTRAMAPQLVDFTRAVARYLNLRLCGIDVMSLESVPTSVDHLTVIEVNASPGLDGYANLGAATGLHLKFHRPETESVISRACHTND